jgi:hypothetical protein
LVDPATGTKYVYAAATAGAHIAVEKLKERVITMRLLRGARVMALVELGRAPMKTKYKYKKSERPDFRIIDWYLPGGDGGMLSPPTAPQLPSPAAAKVPATKEAQPTQPSEPKADPISSGPQPQAQRTAKPKPPVTVADETLTRMGDVKPVSSEEVLDDKIPW